MYRLIASDIDGTLLRDDLTVGEKTREAIRKAYAKGVRFAISSGRFISGFDYIGDHIGVPTIYSGLNGAVVKDGEEYVVFKPVEDTLVQTILEKAGDKVECLILFAEDCYLIDSTDYYFEFQKNLYNGVAGIKVDFRKESLQEAKAKLGKPIVKILLKDRDTVKLRGIRDMLNADGIKGKATLSAANSLEIIPEGLGKGKAIEALVKHLGIEKSQVICFGDYYNDLDMFQASGLAVAMGNAVDDVKAAAGYVTLSNNEDGIAAALEKFVLSEENPE